MLAGSARRAAAPHRRPLRLRQSPGIARLVDLITRYGEAIERDLLPTVDPYALWQARRWRRLLNLIEHLPPQSHYKAAQSQDEELARRYHELRERDESITRHRDYEAEVRTWTPERASIAQLTDAVRTLTAVTIRAHSEKKSSVAFPPVPRPSLAIDRIGQRLRNEVWDEILAVMEED